MVDQDLSQCLTRIISVFHDVGDSRSGESVFGGRTTIYTGTDAPSMILLPVIPGKGL